MIEPLGDGTYIIASKRMLKEEVRQVVLRLRPVSSLPFEVAERRPGDRDPEQFQNPFYYDRLMPAARDLLVRDGR